MTHLIYDVISKTEHEDSNPKQLAQDEGFIEPPDDGTTSPILKDSLNGNINRLSAIDVDYLLTEVKKLIG